MLGVLGWCTWLDKKGRLNFWPKQLHQPTNAVFSTPKKKPELRRKQMMGSGIIVMGLTEPKLISIFLNN